MKYSTKMRKYLHFTFIVLLAVSFACSSKSNKDQERQSGDSLKFDRTLFDINENIINDSNNDELYIQRADYYLSVNKTDSALRDILIAIDINKENANHYITLSDAYLKIGNPDKCFEALNRTLVLDTRNKEALIKKAQLYLIMRDYDNTYSTISELLSIDKLNPIAYFVNAIAYLEEQDTTNAIRNLHIAVDQKQDYYEAQLQLGVLYSDKKNPVAINYLQNSINLKPRTIEPYHQLGLFFQENNRVQSAIITYNSILDIEPEFVPALYNLGYIQLVYQQNFVRAIDYFSKVVQLTPEYAEAWYNRGYCYELLGQLELARNDYQETLKIMSNYSKAIDGLNRLDAD